MNSKYLLLSVLLLMSIFQVSHAQLDPSKNYEVRLSLAGSNPYIPFIDDAIDQYGSFSSLGVSLLKRYKDTPYFGKAEVRGRYSNQAQFDNQEQFGELLARNLSVYLGVEQQYQYKHFGVFLGMGIDGGYFDYTGDFTLPEFGNVQDLSHVRYSIAAKGSATFFTNVTDRLYFFSTFSISFMYVQATNSQMISESFEDGSSFNNGLHIDGIGLAYKF